MIKTLQLATLLLFAQTTFVKAQVITSTPQFPTENDSVTIVFNAAEGSGGLKDYAGDIYAHTGLITDKSTSNSDWKYATDWNINNEKFKLTKVGTNLYQLKLNPSIREFYGVTTTDKVKKMAFVFRSGDRTKEGKAAGNLDIFYDIFSSNLSLTITSPITKPVIAKLNDSIKLSVSSNSSDSMAIYLDNAFVKGLKGKAITDSIKITSSAKSWIKIKAFKNTETVSDSFYFFVQNPTTSESLPTGVKAGINYINDSTVTFVLFAPKKKSIFLIGDFNNWMPDNSYLMKKDSNLFWITISNLQKGKEYIFQYLIDGTIRIADPYSEKISDPFNDKTISTTTYPSLIQYPEGKTSEIAGVIQTGQTPYNWEVKDFLAPAKEKLVIYEVLIRDFTSNRNIKTITDTLQYLKRLGINAIELMPFNEFEGNDSWGYNPAFYFAPDKAYGTKNDYKKFVDECHKLGIAVIQDQVLNHSYGQSPLVRMYFEGGKPSVDNPWYNQVSNMKNPDAQWGYDFNHESIYTQKLVDSICSFWMKEYNIDGFRFDFTKGFTNTPYGTTSWASEYDTSRIKILKRMATEVWKRKPSAYVIFEHLSDNSEEKELASAGIMLWGNQNWSYAQSAMGYMDGSDFSPISYKNKGWSQPNLVGYMESHDEERVAFKCITWGNSAGSYNIKDIDVMSKRLELNNLFFLTIPGPKMIWQFGELGYDIKIDSGGRLGIKPDKWEYKNEAARANIYNMVRTINGLKQNEAIFSTNNFSISATGKIKQIKLTSTDGAETVIIVGNFDVTEQTATVSFPNTGSWYNFFAKTQENIDNTSYSIKLQPGEYRMYTSKEMNQPIYVGVDKFFKNESAEIFPNPCHNILYINTLSEVSNIKIFDLIGNTSLNIKAANEPINTSALRNGFYFVQLNYKNGRKELRKFVKN